MKEVVFIESCEMKLGKKENTYYKLNGKIFVWEEENGKKLKANIGKTFEMEIDRTTDYPKLVMIYEETDLPPTVEKPGEAIVVKDRLVKAVVKEEIKSDELTLIRDQPNSRTIGQGKDQIKLYFKDADDLNSQILALENHKLMPKEWFEYNPKTD